MRYVDARLDEYQREEAYRIYVTNSLQHAPRGQSLTKSYYELIHPAKKDTRSGDEIALEVIKRAGLNFGSKQP